MPPRALMVQGTTSDAGKTTLVAGLCRVLKRRGIKVAPFKPQNMALNSAVTEDGGEIGRAQALQAQASGIAPTTDMNPVLLKPSSDTGAQVIVHGKALETMQAAAFHEYKPMALKAVIASFKRLQNNYECVIAEGAGSPAEINLREGDIANMGFAEAVNCPVILVADIDKGGVFAHLVGTLELLSDSEQERVIGFVINKFRGDISLLEPGIHWLEEKTQKPVFGVIPYLHNLLLDSEDAIDTQQEKQNARLNIAVIVLPHTSNHTDFDALRAHNQINVEFIAVDSPLPGCDLLILPGSKNVCGDLSILKQHQWSKKLNRHLRYGGKVLGICGGYQMLGDTINDPHALESDTVSSKGFGFIPMHTHLKPKKILKNRDVSLQLENRSSTLKVYEIHCGTSQFYSEARHPFHTEEQTTDGFLSEDNAILGCYFHGLFDTAVALEHICEWAGATISKSQNIDVLREAQLERLADSVESSIDIDAMFPHLRDVNTSEAKISHTDKYASDDHVY